MIVAGIDHLVKVTLLENQYQALLIDTRTQRQLRGLTENHNRLNQIFSLALYRIGERLVSWGIGLQKRYGTLADVSA
jgi:hypothetical protein